MTITINDPDLISAFERDNPGVEIKDAAGNVIATIYRKEGFGKPPPGFTIPFTEEELAEHKKQKGGRPFADVLRDLEEKYGT